MQGQPYPHGRGRPNGRALKGASYARYSQYPATDPGTSKVNPPTSSSVGENRQGLEPKKKEEDKSSKFEELNFKNKEF
jgi:hypothetical protein